MERLIWICLAGAAGTGARYLVGLWAGQRLGVTFPYGTLIVNVAGCFAVAVLAPAASAFAWSPTAHAALAIGFLGGFTTFSSFNYETTRLIQDGQLGPAVLNVALNVFGGFAAGCLGLLFGRQFVGR